MLKVLVFRYKIKTQNNYDLGKDGKSADYLSLELAKLKYEHIPPDITFQRAEIKPTGADTSCI